MSAGVQPLSLYCLEFTCPANLAEAAEDLISGLGYPVSVWTAVEQASPMVRIYLESEAAAKAAAAEVTCALGQWREVAPGFPPEIHHVRLEWDDWPEAWKRHFRPFRASRRFVVKPTWETWAAEPHDLVLEVDPGMSFGTGQHGTTQACLELIDTLADRLGPSVPFLDVGCGSGILALAAWKSGYRPVVALDNDPQAVATAAANLEQGGAGEALVRQQDLAELDPSVRFRVVAANLLASLLVTHAERLVAVLDRRAGDAFLIVSGILDRQYEAVLDRFGALGLTEDVRVARGEWTSGCLVLPKSPRGT